MLKNLFMIKKILFLILLIQFHPLCSNNLDLLSLGPVRTIVMTHLNDEWILELDDGSLWKMMLLQHDRPQTWYEWWYKITPKEWALDNSYFFDPRSWESNVAIQIYEVKDAIFCEYRHLFMNVATGKKAYAEFIPFGTRHVPKLAFVSKFLEFPLGQPSKICNNEFIKDIVILNDDSIWRVFPAEKKFRSFEQWWNNIKIDQPDSPFVFSVDSWERDDSIQLYFYEEDLEINSIYDHHNRKTGLYLIENLSRGQLAYTRPLTVMQLVNLYVEYAREEYDEGYSDGKGSCDCD